jgi:hypothetical protein
MTYPDLPKVIKDELEKSTEIKSSQKMQNLGRNIIGIIVVLSIVLWTINYWIYIVKWFVDIFSGHCYWWSLGFLCHT